MLYLAVGSDIADLQTDIEAHEDHYTHKGEILPISWEGVAGIAIQARYGFNWERAAEELFDAYHLIDDKPKGLSGTDLRKAILSDKVLVRQLLTVAIDRMESRND